MLARALTSSRGLPPLPLHPPTRPLKIALDVARGLVFLHSRRIAHFDLKSPNILLARCVCVRACSLRGGLRGQLRLSKLRAQSTLAGLLARAHPPMHTTDNRPHDSHPPTHACGRDGTAKIADVGMAKILNRDYVTGVVSTLAWCALPTLPLPLLPVLPCALAAAAAAAEARAPLTPPPPHTHPPTRPPPPHYARSAPEMLWGARCTEKADIYSYGIVLWEICSGLAPERGRLRDLRRGGAGSGCRCCCCVLRPPAPLPRTPFQAHPGTPTPTLPPTPTCIKQGAPGVPRGRAPAHPGLPGEQAQPAPHSHPGDDQPCWACGGWVGWGVSGGGLAPGACKL